MREVPRLEDYKVFPRTGFLPDKLPLEKLPDTYYKPWEDLVNVLPSLILTKKIRRLVDKLPLLSTEKLKTIEEYRRGYSVLGFLSHAYIWGVDEATNKLPIQLSQPYIEISNHLGLPPIGTYSGLCLWNFKPILPMEDSEEWDLDNLTTINTFTGSIDESWFYLVSVYFEYKGAHCITDGLNAIKSARENDVHNVTKNLQKLAESIDKLGSVLMRMEEMCDPHVFYFRIRPYLAGWRNMEEAGLSSGVFYGDEKAPRVYAGGSNAQSSLIQTLDILLGVKHHATGARSSKTSNIISSSPKSDNNFMQEMRNYMPKTHTDFLQHLEDVANIRDFVLENGDSNPELTLSYDAALAMLKSFRDKHIQIVTRYIILQAKSAGKAGSNNTLRSGLAKTAKKTEQKGTGGTALLPFLKQCRDETGDPAAGSWGKRILSDGVMNLGYTNRSSTRSPSTSNNKTIGMAGSWIATDDISGHW